MYGRYENIVRDIEIFFTFPKLRYYWRYEDIRLSNRDIIGEMEIFNFLCFRWKYSYKNIY